ncbi:hypothetical protein [Burkholderia latens]|uniref:hypothetical protein n=1 Tax=Burkholderia latens TaxID=488446 RepID=UPI001AE71B03|nr:hypothetical protein [Burkholderia latens]QTO47061.1 hypothetical protein J8I86_08340 [Burkholderia latens]
MESIVDIDVLALQCRSDSSRQYIEEAIRCYRAGAYRAAIVSTWVAVAFDLVDKIRELTLNGNVNATELNTRFENYIKQIDEGNEQGTRSALEFERDILSICRDKFEFFDVHQYTDLERLRDDRHRCAHPSFQRTGHPYQPSAEQARLHIRNAITHVLSLPPVHGRAAIATLVTLVKSEYFPDEDERAAKRLRDSPIGRPTPSLIHGFVDTLIFGFVTRDDALFGVWQVGTALRALFRMFPADVEARAKKQIQSALKNVSDADLSYAVALMTKVMWVWDGLDQPTKDKVVMFVNNCPTDDIIGGLHLLYEIPALRPSVLVRTNLLSKDQLATAIEVGIGELAVPRAIELLSETKSWNDANEIIMRLIMPTFPYMKQEDIKRIIYLPQNTGADLHGAHAYAALIEKISATAIFKNDDLKLMLNDSGAGYLPQAK